MRLLAAVFWSRSNNRICEILDDQVTAGQDWEILHMMPALEAWYATAQLRHPKS